MDSLGRQSSELLRITEYRGDYRAETAIGDERNALGDLEDTKKTNKEVAR